MPEAILGIDPGVKGGWAVVEGGQSPKILRSGKLTAPGASEILVPWLFLQLTVAMDDTKFSAIYLEEPRTFPGKKSDEESAFMIKEWGIGKNFGLLLAVCQLLIHKYDSTIRTLQLVAPAQWQKNTLIKGTYLTGVNRDNKHRAIETVKTFFSANALLEFATSPRGIIRDGICDAILIALYGDLHIRLASRYT